MSDEPRPSSVDAAVAALGAACGSDATADARGCRLQLALAALDAGCDAFLGVDDWPWDFSAEATLYARERGRCGAACVLNESDELRAYEELGKRKAKLAFRDDCADAPARRAVRSRIAALRGAPAPAAPAPTRTVDCDAAAATAWAPVAWPPERVRRARPLPGGGGAYARPCGFDEPATEGGPFASRRLAGGAAVRWLRTAFAFGGPLEALALEARRGSLPATPFGVVYELLTNTLPLRVGDRDGSFGWGVAAPRGIRPPAFKGGTAPKSSRVSFRRHIEKSSLPMCLDPWRSRRPERERP